MNNNIIAIDPWFIINLMRVVDDLLMAIEVPIILDLFQCWSSIRRFQMELFILIIMHKSINY